MYAGAWANSAITGDDCICYYTHQYEQSCCIWLSDAAIGVHTHTNVHGAGMEWTWIALPGRLSKAARSSRLMFLTMSSID